MLVQRLNYVRCWLQTWLLVVLAAGAAMAHAQTSVIDNTYLFLGNLRDTPSISTGTVNNQTLRPVDYAGESVGNAFVNDTISVLNADGTSTSCGSKTVYHVATQAGVESVVGTGADYAEYSITMLAKLDALSGWKRWLDFSNGTLDSGIYALGNDLNFYPNGNVFSGAFSLGKYSLITLTRNTSGLITVYIGNRRVATYNDTAGLYKVPATGRVVFIRDNITGPAPRESIGANIAYINVSNFLKTDAQVADTANNICTVSTTSKITLDKALGESRLADTDQFTVQIKSTGASSTVVNTTTASTTSGAGNTVNTGTGTTGTFTASGGQTYSLTEAGAGSTNIGSYLSRIACTNATAGSTTVLPSGQLVAGTGFSLTPAILDDIRCTITNTRRPPVIRLSAALATARQSAADQFVVSLLNSTGGVVNATTDSTSTGAGNAITAGKGSTGFFTATAGQSYTLQEAMAPGSASQFAQYAKQLVCTNARSAGTAVGGITALGHSVTPQAGDVIDCVVTNSAIPTLQLRQISRFGMGTFAYAGNNGWATQSISTTGVDGTGIQGTAQSLASANVLTTLSASLAPGWRLTALTCVDNNATANGNTGSFGTLSGNTFSIPAANIRGNSQLDCTVTAALGATLSVVKRVNGSTARANPGDNFVIGLTSSSSAGRAALPSTCAVGTALVVPATSLGCLTDSSTSGDAVAAQVATFALVADGTTSYTLSDAMGFGSASTLALYDTKFSCTVSNTGTVTSKGNAGAALLPDSEPLPATPTTLQPNGSPLVSRYTLLPGAADQIVCTFENQTRAAQFTVRKVSTGGVGTFGFGGQGAGANGFPATGYSVTTTSAGVVAAGNTVSLAQLRTLTEVQEATSPGWDLLGASCTDAQSAITGSTGSFGSVNGAVLAIAPERVLPGADLQCVFSNQYVGFTVRGKVIVDDGSGAGTAHDGLQNGTEAAHAGVQVRLTDCANTVFDTATTAGDGSFRLRQMAAPVGSALCVQQLVPGDHRMVSLNKGSTGGSYSAAAMGLAFVAAADTEYTGVVLGNARLSRLTSDNAGQALPGSTHTYAHQFVAGSAASVAFAAVGASVGESWGKTLYLDADCSGTLGTSSVLLTAPRSMQAGERLCLLLQVFVPATAAVGAVHTVTLQADETLAVATLLPDSRSTALSNRDITTVSAGGVLGVGKVFRTLDACPADAQASQALAVPFVTTGTVRPGQCIEYRVRVQNTGTSPVSDVRIHDAVPAYTRLENAFCMGIPSLGIRGCSATLPASTSSGNPVEWRLYDALSGAIGLQPDDRGEVAFCVRVLN